MEVRGAWRVPFAGAASNSAALEAAVISSDLERSASAAASEAAVIELARASELTRDSREAPPAAVGAASATMVAVAALRVVGGDVYGDPPPL